MNKEVISVSLRMVNVMSFTENITPTVGKVDQEKFGLWFYKP